MRRLFICSLLCVLAMAQPGEVHTIAIGYSAAGETQDSPQAISDGRGGIYLLYTGTRGPDGLPNIIFQHYSAKGVPQYSAHGWHICPRDNTQKNPRLVRDADGYLFILWEEHREYLRGIFGLKLSPEGRMEWGYQGEYLAPVGEASSNYHAQPDHNGGLYLAWEDIRGIEKKRQVYVQRIAPYGLPVWQFDGLAVSPTPHRQQRPQIAVTPDRGLLAIWEDFDQGWKLRAQKFTPAGENEWGPYGIGLHPAAEGQNMQAVQMVSDGFGGLLCSYVGLGNGTQGKDIYLMRVTRNGKQVYNKPVCRAVGDQQLPSLQARGADVFLMWEDSRVKGDKDLYAQRLEIQQGTPWWQEDGVLICLSAGNQQRPVLAKDQYVGDYLLAWTDDRSSTSQIYCQKLNTLGEAVWDYAAVPVALHSAEKEQLQLVSDQHGGGWFVWLDHSNPIHPTLQLQHVDPYGIRLDKSIQVLEKQDSSATVLASPSLASGQMEDFYIVWEDYRNGKRNSDIFVQRLDSAGNMLWTNFGYPLCTAPDYQSVPKMKRHEQGLSIAWLDRRNGHNDDIYHHLLDENGPAILTKNGAPLTLADRSQNDLSIDITSSGNVVAVWTDSRKMVEQGFDIYHTSQPLYVDTMVHKDGLPLCVNTGYQTAPSVGVDAKDYAYVSWMDDRSGYYNIRMQYLSADNEKLWGPHGIALSPARGHQRFPEVLPLSNGSCMVAWVDDRHGKQYSKIYIQQMLERGVKALDAAGTVLCARYGRQTNPRLTELNGKGTLVSWLDQRDTTQGYLLMAQQLNPQANKMWPEEGIVIGRFLGENHKVAQCYNQKGTMGYTWEANLNGRKQVHYALQSLASGKVLQTGPISTEEGAHTQPTIAVVDDRFAIAWISVSDGRYRLNLRFVTVQDES